jgi:hypothetical protein
MNTFIRASEVWVPSADRTMLEFGGGLYGSATRFAALSRGLCFGRGEGLPGQAWEQGRPLVLKTFDNSYFRRTAAAHAEGITCGIAVPIYAGDFLTSVLVIFCGDDAAHAGAIELWRNDPAVSSDMTLDDGYYGTTADTFEFMSRRTSFRRGSGLPGLAWQSGLPVFFEDLGKSARFLRADTAQKVGINRGFAIPCPIRGNEHYVLAFLSALNTPIARRFEVWKPDPARSRPAPRRGLLRGRRRARRRRPGTWGSTAARARSAGSFLTGVPAVSDNAGSEPGRHRRRRRRDRPRNAARRAGDPGRAAGRAVAWYF